MYMVETEAKHSSRFRNMRLDLRHARKIMQCFGYTTERFTNPADGGPTLPDLDP